MRLRNLFAAALLLAFGAAPALAQQAFVPYEIDAKTHQVLLDYVQKNLTWAQANPIVQALEALENQAQARAAAKTKPEPKGTPSVGSKPGKK